MRPTEIGVKAPFNRTPAAGCPTLNHTGNSVQLARSRGGYSFASRERFPDYAVEAKKLGYRVGPGTYELHQTAKGVPRAPTGAPYKKSIYSNSYHQGGFYYSGNLLVYDDAFLLRTAVKARLHCQKKAAEVPRSSEQTQATQPADDN